MANKQLAVEIAAILARRFEGLRLRPYLCPAGVATIGYGATRYENGVRVTLTDAHITKPRAELLLQIMIEREYLPAVIRLCPHIDTPERLAAIIDFAFNLGANNLKHSTLRKHINAGEWEAVPTQLMRWVRGGGRILIGLEIRRATECALI